MIKNKGTILTLRTFFDNFVSASHRKSKTKAQGKGICIFTVTPIKILGQSKIFQTFLKKKGFLEALFEVFFKGKTGK